MTAFLLILGTFAALIVATVIWAIEEHARVTRRSAFRRAALARQIARREA